MFVLRQLLSILILPFVVVVVVPRWLMSAYSGIDSRWSDGSASIWLARGVGMALFAAGFLLFGWCVVLFGRVGRGTLAPWDPTTRLVAVGPYRYVRNPMISGVAAMLFGEVLLLGSLLLAAWAIVFMIINHTYFLVAEEPGLLRRFGGEYEEYMRQIPRWIPRLPTGVRRDVTPDA